MTSDHGRHKRRYAVHLPSSERVWKRGRNDMMTIGEQIQTFRRAKGLTQQSLADLLGVTRSTVSNYEAGRRMPDGEMLLKISEVLECRFGADAACLKEDVAAQSPASAAIEPTVENAEPEGPKAMEAPTAQNMRRQRQRWLALAVVTALLCVGVAVFLTLRHRAAPVVYSADNGATYTVEQFQTTTAREEGKAFLTCERGMRIISNDGAAVWMYDFVFHEMNGVGASIDNLEACTFYGDKVLPMVIAGSSLSQYGLNDSIPARGEWKLTGGLPVSDNVIGVGIQLNCTDDTGAKHSFTDYLKLNSVG